MVMTQRREQNWAFLSKMLLMKSDRPPYAHKYLDKPAEVLAFLSVYIPCLHLHTHKLSVILGFAPLFLVKCHILVSHVRL